MKVEGNRDNRFTGLEGDTILPQTKAAFNFNHSYGI